MKKSKISMVDIASRLKISTTTVSFILNGKAKEKRISDELTERVLKLVEEVGYRPTRSLPASPSTSRISPTNTATSSSIAAPKTGRKEPANSSRCFSSWA
jgi:transcriptional regulator with XRE-family HTH domain